VVGHKFNIFLIGFMGCGKTSLGKLLARKLKFEFLDTDLLIEEQEKRALKTAWQKEKLTAIIEEEQDEIPEMIFKQAMDSISMENALISESLAEILAKQGKTDKAIEMYKKLSLRNPEKNSYFADRIKDLLTNNI
jgi:shikimate kinase